MDIKEWRERWRDEGLNPWIDFTCRIEGCMVREGRGIEKGLIDGFRGRGMVKEINYDG